MAENDLPGVDKKLVLKQINENISELCVIRDYLERLSELPFELSDEQKEQVKYDFIDRTKQVLENLINFLNTIPQ